MVLIYTEMDMATDLDLMPAFFQTPLPTEGAPVQLAESRCLA